MGLDISKFDNAHGNTVQSLYNTVFGVQQNGQFLREPYGPGREKTCLQRFANNQGADQPAHSRSLISAFVICLLKSIVSRLSTSEISNF